MVASFNKSSFIALLFAEKKIRNKKEKGRGLKRMSNDNSVGSSEFMYLCLILMVFVLNGLELHFQGFDFNMDIPEKYLDLLFGGGMFYTGIRQVRKAERNVR